MFLNISEANERLEKELAGLTDSLESTKQELDAVNEKMDQLKTVLYAKFGKVNYFHVMTKAINLER
jgi:prefoldin subunit 5